MTKAVVSKMKKSRDGQIIFVNSAAGQCPIWGYTAYGATKFALRGFAEALYMELLPYNVQVSVIYPPNTNTEGYQVPNFSNYCFYDCDIIQVTGRLFSYAVDNLFKNLEKNNEGLCCNHDF